MSEPVSDLKTLLSSMSPTRNDGVYVFASVPFDTDLRTLEPLAVMRETEGLSVVVAEDVAARSGLAAFCRMAWITLRVHSDLEAVGLTAAFSRALAQVDIPCNVVAGAFHDHLFVPVDKADAAMDALRALQHSVPSD